jgi:hypothetical protein
MFRKATTFVNSATKRIIDENPHLIADGHFAECLHLIAFLTVQLSGVDEHSRWMRIMAMQQRNKDDLERLRKKAAEANRVEFVILSGSLQEDPFILMVKVFASESGDPIAEMQFDLYIESDRGISLMQTWFK